MTKNLYRYAIISQTEKDLINHLETTSTNKFAHFVSVGHNSSETIGIRTGNEEPKFSLVELQDRIEKIKHRLLPDQQVYVGESPKGYDFRLFQHDGPTGGN